MANEESVSQGIERAFSQAAWCAQNAAIEIGYEYQRPSRTMRPRVFMDGNEWCALYGENLQDGVAGFGKSPEKACQAFDAEWAKETP